MLALAPAGAAAQTPAPTVAQTATQSSAPTLPSTVPPDPNALVRPANLTQRPLGRQRTGQQVLDTASALPKIRVVRAKHERSTSGVFLKGTDRWQVSFYDRRNAEIGQVQIDDRSGAVTEQWTGPQVAWTMARGYPGAFGRKANALYIWIPLLVVFVLPFVDPRRPLRIRHLDLLMLCALSVSLAFFNDGNLDASVPLAYPPLLYLLGRLLWVAYRGRDDTAPREPLRLLVPASWLAIAVVFLVGFRVGLNVTDSNVIDVGYAGVIGADKLAHGNALYGTFPQDNPAGDTYGPVNYIAYVPFELAMPWTSKTWDDLPAAHAAAIVFDLLCVALLFLIGRRVRGPTLGTVLAFAWVAFPFTLFAANSNANDSLVAALLLGALYAATATGRGALAALAGLTKFAPLALVPLFAFEDRRPLRFALGFLVVLAVAGLPIWLQGDLRLFYERTIEYQAERGSPFSVWGLWDDTLQRPVQIAAVLFALLAGFIPRRRDAIGLAAVSGAILIALQLGVTHWFYLYIVWFLPSVFLVVFGRDAEPEPRPASA